MMAGSEAAGPRLNLDESPLARLATRKGPDGAPYLAVAEAAAGERLRLDWTRANLLPGVTQRWEASPRGGGDLSDSALDARARVERALETLGPELGGVAVDVCCFLKGLEQVERERRWPARSAKLMLRAALEALARHYGLRSGEGGNGRIRAWRAPPAGR